MVVVVVVIVTFDCYRCTTRCISEIVVCSCTSFCKGGENFVALRHLNQVTWACCLGISMTSGI